MRFFITCSAVIFLAIMLSSCNSPMDKAYSLSSYNEDMQAIMQSNKLTDDDIDVLTKYIAISQVAGNDLQGKTYNDILSKIKDIQKANGSSKSQNKLDKEITRTKLSPYLSVSLKEKIFSNVDGKNSFTYTVLFQNKSPQNIKMIIGNITLADVLEREIKKIDIVLDEEIKSNSSLKKLYIVTYNHNDENDKRIRTKNLSDLRIEWNPEKIIFTSGQVAD